MLFRSPEIAVDANKLKDANNLKDVAAGTLYNVLEGVTAKVGQADIPAANITAQIKDAAGNVVADLNSSTPSFTFGSEGTYKVIYTVKNPDNAAKSATKEFTVTVTPKVPDTTGGDGTQAQSRTGYMEPQDGAGQAQPEDVTAPPAGQVQPEQKVNPENQEEPEDVQPEPNVEPEEGTIPTTQGTPEDTQPEPNVEPEEGTVPTTQETPEDVQPEVQGTEEGSASGMQELPEEGIQQEPADGAEGQAQPEA